MKTLDLTALLRINPYPAGHRAGQLPDGSKSVIAYFIMGRSEKLPQPDLRGDPRRHPHPGL